MTRKLERKNDGWSAYLISQYRFYIFLSLKPILQTKASELNITREDFEKGINESLNESNKDSLNQKEYASEKSKMIVDSIVREELLRTFSEINPMVHAFEVLSDGKFGNYYRINFKEFLSLKKRLIDAQRVSEQRIVDLTFTPTIWNSVELAIADILLFFVTTSTIKQNTLQQTA